MNTTTPTHTPGQSVRDGQGHPASQPSPLAEMERFVDGPRLLEILWDKASRPSLRWLRAQQRCRSIPFTRIGRRVWFMPNQVRQHLTQWLTAKPKPVRAVRRPPFPSENAAPP